MSNHIHLIWQALRDHDLKNVQRDFLKYTGQQILNQLKETNSELADELYVGEKIESIKCWRKCAEHFTGNWNTFIRILFVAGLCGHAEDYHYSSTRFYFKSDMDFEFLQHFNG